MTSTYVNMILDDFVKEVIKYDDINSIIDNCKTQSDKGFVFERICDLIIKFGCCERFSNLDYTHKIGNVNTGLTYDLIDINKYIHEEKVYSGNSTGVSDITLQNIKTKEYIFISCKYPKCSEDKNKEKLISYYDIQNILAVTTKHKNIYEKYKIFLLVQYKDKLIKKLNKVKDSSNYLKDYIIDNILDLEELNKYFIIFKNIIKKHIIKNKIDYNKLFTVNKKNLLLRFHQQLLITKIIDLIHVGHKDFLLGCKCRSGKTFICGGLISELNKLKNINTLILTAAPTETIPQFTDDLFSKFIDFDQHNIYYNVKTKSRSFSDITFNNINNNILVLSKQLLQRYIISNNKVITNIKNLNLDLIFFDENHYSGTTDLSNDILDSYSNNNTIKVYMTATYNKPLTKWNIPEECRLFWNIEDEHICKNIYEYLDVNNNIDLDNDVNILKLYDRHDKKYVKQTLEYFTKLGFTLKNIFEPYTSMPNLCLLTNMFDEDRYNDIKLKIENSKYGFSFDTLFSINKNTKDFNFRQEVKLFLRYISGSQKEIDFKDGDKSIYGRINKIISNKQNKQNKQYTQLWFLPSDNINDISMLLQKLMLEDNILKNYEIMCINSNNDDISTKHIKREIMLREEQVKKDNKYGLILLVANMLSLGITLHNCDVVFLFNDSLSYDKIMQQMYRCMTERDNKKYGIVVDLKISRMLNTLINYSNSNKSIEDKFRYLIDNHLINIDIDMFNNKKINSDVLINKLINKWKDDPINNFTSLLKNLDNDYIHFDNEIQKKINKTFDNNIKNKNINSKIIFTDDSDNIQEIQSGKEIIKEVIIENNNIDENDLDKEIEIEINISFTKDVLPYIIPLVCILTIKNNNKDFIKMLNDIKNNPELLEIFNDQCLIWWNKKDLIDLIKDIVDKYFDKNSNTYNISIQFKLSLQSLLDNPKELLELITDCLKPKEIEKKEFGEVFTPIFLINEMLDKLPKEVWIDKNLKWFDPCVGMGNFMIVVYLRLMDGLKKIITDDKMRMKHILENMLYMSELNKKNVFICNQIFDINNEYKLNLYNGDSLKLDIKKEWNIDKFDIIIGNPPYNEELTSVGAKPLYNKFIEYYIDKTNMLSFIIPSRWFCGGKGLDKFRNMMLKRKDIVFIKHFDDASRIFGNNVNIEGGVNYFLKNRNYNGSCKFNDNDVILDKYDVFVDSKYYNIIDKILDYDKITKYYISQDYYKIQTNDTRLKDNKTDDDVLCYVSQQKGFTKYIDKKEIKKDYNFWKVITARANGSNDCFGNIFIGKCDEVHTKSYISFKLNSEQEAKSLLCYMKCRLPNFMLSLRKISQDISESTCKWIPLPKLNREWTDEDVYKYFELTEDDIKLINDTYIGGYDKKINKKYDTTNKLNKPNKPNRSKKINKNKNKSID